MIMNLTQGAVRTVSRITQRADAALVRQAAANAAASLSTIQQRRTEGELALRHLDRLGKARSGTRYPGRVA